MRNFPCSNTKMVNISFGRDPENADEIPSIINHFGDNAGSHLK